MQLVEVARGAATSESTVEALVKLAEDLGKVPVVTRDTPGFIVNRVARPFYGEALRMLGEGVASHQEERYRTAPLLRRWARLPPSGQGWRTASQADEVGARSEPVGGYCRSSDR